MWTLQPPALYFALFGCLVVSLVALAALHFAAPSLRRVVVVALTFLGGLFYAVEFFIPPDPATESAWLGGWNLTATATVIGNATQVISAFTFLLGVYNLVLIHGNLIRRRRPGWGNSIAFFAAFGAMVVFAFWRDWHLWFGGGAPPAWVRDPNEGAALPQDAYTLLFEGLYRNLESTMFSILAFYIVSAAYRAFRVRTPDAAVLMVVALVLMMGQVPLGMALTSWLPETGLVSQLRIEKFSLYVLTTINAPVQRAIGFGLGLGLLAMALRIWLSLERGTFFREES